MKKVKCINVKSIRIPANIANNLTLNKVYEATDIDFQKYEVIDDLGNKRIFFKERFIDVVEESLPEEYIVENCARLGTREIKDELKAKYPDSELTDTMTSWNYYIFSKKARPDYPTRIIRFSDAANIAELMNLPLIPYAKWKELYNKTTKTPEMTNEKKIIIATTTFSNLWTAGKEYEVIHENAKNSNGQMLYTFVLDDGRTSTGHPSYFKVKTTTVEKKIIGYKVKQGVDAKVMKAIIDMDDPTYVMSVDGSYIERIRKAGIESLVESVYEPEKPKTLEIELNGAKLSIYKDGTINFVFGRERGTTSIDGLQQIVDDCPYVVTIGDFSVTATAIHIGCAKGLDLTIKDVKNIIDQYNKFK